ncbi:MAG: preprotein translocase subunit SecA [Clostridia bacterium]|nr:preprotein translocase subunit SecA [Clostridia bacterium]
MGLVSYMASSDSRSSVKKLVKMAEKVEALEPKYQAMSDAELKNQTSILKERLSHGETLDDILYDAYAVNREASWRVLKMKHFPVQIVGGICLHQGRIAEMKTGEGKTLVATLPSYLNALTGRGVHIVTVNDYLARRDAEWMGRVQKFLGLTVGVVVPGMDDEEKRAAYNCDIVYGTNNEFGFDYLRDNLKTSIPAMVQRELNFCIIDEVDSILIDEARTPLIISGRGGESSRLYEQVDALVRRLSGGFEEDYEEVKKKAPAAMTKEDKKVSSETGDENEEDGVDEEDDWVDEKKLDRERKKLEKEAKKNEKEAKRREGMTEEERESDDKLNTLWEQMKSWDYIVNRKDRSVTITEKGAKKAEQFFGIANLGDIENADLNHHIQQALKAHELFKRDQDYIVSDEGEILIVDEFTGRLMVGRRYSDGLHQAIEAKEHVKIREENKTQATVTFQNYFRLYKKLSGMTGTAKTEEAEFRTIYSLDVVEIPTNMPVIRHDMPDVIFSTVESKKKAIIDEIVKRHEKGQPVLVGTVTVEKSEEIARLLVRHGIKHNILNAKNHEREAGIVAQAGRYGAVTIATNMAGRGTDILLGGNPEYLAIKRMREENFSEEAIEVARSYADREFTEEETAARARYAELYELYKKETDEEKKKVIEAGGLLILGTERHESRRIDNQLRGRSGRQGDPGDSVFFISLEDDLAKRFGGERLKNIYDTLLNESESLQSKMLSRSIENAQKQIEGRNFGIRKRTLEYDEVMNEQRKTIYAERMKVLRGEDIHEQMLKYIPDYVAKVVGETVDTSAMPEKWDEDELNKALKERVFPDECDYVITRKRLENWDYETAIEKITNAVTKGYEKKIEEIGKILIPVAGGFEKINFSQIERDVLLRTVDRNWVDHIDAMDQLRKGIGLRGYAQQDPVLAYKEEGYEMFSDMIERIQTSSIYMLLKGRMVNTSQQRRQQQPEKTAEKPAAAEKAPSEPSQKALAAENTAAAANRTPSQQGPGAGNLLDSLRKNQQPQEYVTNMDSAPAPVKAKKKIGPNDPCPCGSGKKYKKCCGSVLNGSN